MVKAARTFNMITLRMKSLVSDVGLKIRGRELQWFAPTIYDATYEIMQRAITTQLRQKKFYHTLTSDEDVLDDMSHEPWIWVHCNTLAFASSPSIILFGDGATLSSSVGPPQDCDAKSHFWKNVWVSKNEDRQCVASSLSNLLYFMGDPIAGKLFWHVRKICHDKVRLSQNFETMNSNHFPGNIPLYWMMSLDH